MNKLAQKIMMQDKIQNYITDLPKGVLTKEREIFENFHKRLRNLEFQPLKKTFSNNSWFCWYKMFYRYCLAQLVSL